MSSTPASRSPKLSETEWEVMRALWARHPDTSACILERLQAHDPTWHPKTLRTLLARLVKKKAIAFSPEGRTYIYRPLVTEEASRGAASEDFIDRIFGGSLKPMLAYFVEQRKVSR
jgi:BlaI family penicillinase repressor